MREEELSLKKWEPASYYPHPCRWPGLEWGGIEYNDIQEHEIYDMLMHLCSGVLAQPPLQNSEHGAAEQGGCAPLQVLRHPQVLPVQGGTFDWHLSVEVISLPFFDFFYFCFDFPPVEVGTPERGHRAFSSHRTWSKQSPFTRATAERRLRHASGEPTVPFQYVLILESGWKVASRILQQDLSSIE